MRIVEQKTISSRIVRITTESVGDDGRPVRVTRDVAVYPPGVLAAVDEPPLFSRQIDPTRWR